MHKEETTYFPFLIGTILVMAVVIFLSMFNHEAVASGIYPANSAIALLNYFLKDHVNFCSAGWGGSGQLPQFGIGGQNPL